MRFAALLAACVFIATGLALVLGYRLPSVNVKVAIGIAFIVFGVAIALGASVGDAALLAASILLALLILGGVNFSAGARFYSGEARVEHVVSSFSSLSVTVAPSLEGRFEGRGGSARVSDSTLRICCGEFRVELPPIRRLELKSNFGRLNVNVSDVCLEELSIHVNFGGAVGVYRVPKGCLSRLVVRSDFSSARISVLVPQGTRVLYTTSASFGSATVEAPSGSTSSNSSTMLIIECHADFGSAHVRVEEYAP